MNLNINFDTVGFSLLKHSAQTNLSCSGYLRIFPTPFCTAFHLQNNIPSQSNSPSHHPSQHSPHVLPLLADSLLACFIILMICFPFFKLFNVIDDLNQYSQMYKGFTQSLLFYIIIFYHMLKIRLENHLIVCDSQQQYIAAFTFEIVEPELKKKDENVKKVQELKSQYPVEFCLRNKFQYEWSSEYFDLEVQDNQIKDFGSLPLSLETFLDLYEDPHKWKIALRPKEDDLQLQTIVNQPIGKLIVETSFSGNPFLLPVECKIPASKNIKVVLNAIHDEQILCSAETVQAGTYQEVPFYKPKKDENISHGFDIYTFQASERVDCEHICVLRGRFNKKELKHYDRRILLVSPVEQDIKFIPNLEKTMKMLNFIDKDVIIVQNVDTIIEDSYRMVFYTDLQTLYSRIFKSFLYSRIYEKWVIEGMVHYSRDNRHFQDCLSEISQLLSEGEELFPLQNGDYSFDHVWKVKAKFIYHILANLSQNNLTKTLIEQSNKRKLTMQIILKKMKDIFGLQKLKTIYENQFINCTGINRIFYEMEHSRRDHKIRITLRQKALACNIFKKYNRYRIKLEESYGLVSPIMEKIIQKNEGKKNQMVGPLAIPKFLKCIPYFVGNLSVEIENSEPFFEQLLEQNITEKTTDVKPALRSRKVTGKKNEQENSDTISWMMLDTGLCFPAVYKGKNLKESVIEGLMKRTYESEIQELKILNSISIRDHSQSGTICKLLIDKIKIYTDKENTKISVKRKILQLLPQFISKSNDITIWDDILSLLKLYQPVCIDFSEQGNLFLHSLIESVGNLTYNIEMSNYFEQFHRIFLAISRYHHEINEEKFQQLHKQLYSSMMKWISKYSLEILQEALGCLQIAFIDPKRHKGLVKIITENVLPYIDTLKLKKNDSKVIRKIYQCIEQHITLDKNGDIRGVYFFYTTQKKEKEHGALNFLNEIFSELQQIKQKNFEAYDKCLENFKEVLNKNKQKYAFTIQNQELNQNQNYFLAEYLWKNLCSSESLKYPRIRLAWMKIYRVFYFYFTPITTIVKLKKNYETQQFALTQSQTKQVLENIMDFIPDINWFSVYDSSNVGKNKKATENQDQGRKRRREVEEFQFEDQERNHFTEFIKKNPGKDTWQDLSKEALKILITQYENKDIANTSSSDQKYKRIVDQLKNLTNLLKRGSTPHGFTYEKLKRKIIRSLDEHQQSTQYADKVLDYLQQTLEAIQRKKKQKEMQKNNSTIVKLSFMDFGGNQEA